MPDYTAPNRTNAGRDLFKSMSKKPKAKEPAKKASMAIRVGEYGRYQIKSGYVAGVYTARAFPKPPTRARGLIAEATGKTEEAAITSLYSVIDARETRRGEGRRTDPSTGVQVPTSDEYVEALNSVDLTKPQRAMMMALSLAAADGLTEERVATAGSYKSTASAQNALASAGRMIAGFLSSETGSKARSTRLDGIALIGFCGDPGHEEKSVNWIMHSELCAAIRIAT
ncbi:hypothetical protein TRM7557_01031 [Tritonibacter multivorans]|uniref:Uncharacterized protein n=1 Tax=Tritonibacter multivorans TaxID=928856 RepID=A0A0P1G4G5_9RHOB|nr:hypothetical protein [Tritonibacter multivorans]MDA7421861.1 hypothetical protein [Tritonibacter multivorans]CUH76731.1 hypothetical protein TRM7557_01031 [Tritonibacter multivorans]SFD07702.1 hypothetical protein SAMN04488049_106174 [Tritonibacter multivorans]